MSNGVPNKKDDSGGTPAWVMTFADLMSLLMVFFVLLLSFSEMDIQKYKQIAGSMKSAFGVQRQIKHDEMPKGTSVIALEFSPGRPSPTPINIMRQNTIDETRQSLEFTDAITNAEEEEPAETGEQDDSSEITPIQNHSSEETSQDFPGSGPDTGEARSLAEVDLSGKEVTGQPVNEETSVDAQKLIETFESEIDQGMVAIETIGDKILIRIREKGSFPSGSSVVKGSFLPVLSKLRNSLKTIDGKVIVAGHTDNIPIKTVRFRSNWDLSSARAVTVVHKLLADNSLNAERFVVEGHGEAHPVIANDNADNRALNSRVEITIIQGEANDYITEQSAHESISSDQDPVELMKQGDVEIKGEYPFTSPVKYEDSTPIVNADDKQIINTMGLTERPENIATDVQK